MVSSRIDLPPLHIPSLLRSHNLSPKKELGQNFLIEPTILQKIIDHSDIPENASILEIGPGLGSLTRYLAASAENVVAVEIDRMLIPILEDVLSPWDNVKIIQGDMLKLDPAELMDTEGYLVIANIPYFITSALIRHLLESNVKPNRLVLTIQREVAQRICAPQGKLSLLALSVQIYGKPQQIVKIPAGAFYPSPKVDSATLRIDLYPEPRIKTEQIEDFFKLAKAGFGQKRKTLRNSLSSGLSFPTSKVEDLLQQTNIDPKRRAETLTIEEWQLLTNCYCKNQ